MGNENEVKYLLEKTKSVFLPGDFSDPDGKPDLYSLEEEFRKTKRNRNLKFLGLVVLFLFVIISVALTITFFVQERGKNQKVDISSFQDLKLKEMIDSSQKQEGELEIARKELATLEIEYSRELERLKRDFEELKNIIPKFSVGTQNLFKITKTSVEKMSIGQTELHIHFIILNPYGLTYNLKGFPAEIYIDDKLAGTGNLKNQLKFNEDIFSQDGIMVFKLNNLKSIFGAVKGAIKGEIKYSVKGNVIIDAFGMQIKQPYSYQDSLPVNIVELILN